ncbi:MAG: hypothetical protein AB7E49_09370 [Campylobacterales bacterium]
MKLFRVLFWLTVLGVVIGIFVANYNPTQYRHPLHQGKAPADAEAVGHPFGGR